MFRALTCGTFGDGIGKSIDDRSIVAGNRICCLLMAALFPVYGMGVQVVEESRALADLSLEELANIQITSVTRKELSLSRAPASIFVITASDIVRSGATSLPEALRLAPNLLVAQADARDYAISARGFNSTISNKLQVLIDGRIVYTPLYSGVFWDAQDVLLDDIERIEVISGPGSSIWGANAVNGVVNVITRSTSETQGTLIKASGGNLEKNIAARYGGVWGENGHYRFYAKFNDREATRRSGGSYAGDDWTRRQAGFRIDWGDVSQSVQLQGDVYSGNFNQVMSDSRSISGANLLAHWQKQLDSGARIKLSAWHDYTDRSYPGLFSEQLHTTYLEMRHTLQSLGRHNFQWSLDYRYARDRVDNSAFLAFLPAKKNLGWKSLMVQDEISLHDNLQLVINARIEHNNYTGTEFLPGIRLTWNPKENQLLWGTVSRAVRTPSRIDREYYVPGQAPYTLSGGPDFQSETARVYEVGYRMLASTLASWSVTLFHTDYLHLRSVEPAMADSFELGNGLEGTSMGVETWGNYQVSEDWRLSAGFIALNQRLYVSTGSAAVSDGQSEGNDPSHQWLLRSQWNMGDEKTLDLIARRVGALPEPEVPAYVAVDVHFGWWLQQNTQLSFTVRNLFDGWHPEFGAASKRSEIGRSIYLGLKWSF